MGVMPRTLDLGQRRSPGNEIRHGGLHLSPSQTDRLAALSFAMRFRGVPIEVELGREELAVRVPADGGERPVAVGVGDEVREIAPGERHAFALAPKAVAR